MIILTIIIWLSKLVSQKLKNTPTNKRKKIIKLLIQARKFQKWISITIVTFTLRNKCRKNIVYLRLNMLKTLLKVKKSSTIKIDPKRVSCQIESWISTWQNAKNVKNPWSKKRKKGRSMHHQIRKSRDMLYLSIGHSIKWRPLTWVRVEDLCIIQKLILNIL